MGKPVVYLFLARWDESWFDLSDEEHASLLAAVTKSRDDVGGKGIVGADCDWSTPEWHFFGVEEFPSIEALQKHIRNQQELGFTDYLEETFVVGTPWEAND